MGKTWTRIDPNMGLTPIPYMSGLIYLTPSLYGTLLVYYSVSNLTYLTSFVPIKCIKEVVCQLRPCYIDQHIILQTCFLPSILAFSNLQKAKVPYSVPRGYGRMGVRTWYVTVLYLRTTLGRKQRATSRMNPKSGWQRKRTTHHRRRRSKSEI